MTKSNSATKARACDDGRFFGFNSSLYHKLINLNESVNRSFLQDGIIFRPTDRRLIHA